MTYWIHAISSATYTKTMPTSKSKRIWRSKWFMRQRKRSKEKIWLWTLTNVWKIYSNGSKSVNSRNMIESSRQSKLRTKNKSKTSSQIASFKMLLSSMKNLWICIKISKKLTLNIILWKLNQYSKKMQLEIRSTIIWKAEATSWHSLRLSFKGKTKKR